MMDDKPAQRALANDGPVPMGVDIRAKLKKLAEAKLEDVDKPEPPKKKAKDD